MTHVTSPGTKGVIQARGGYTASPEATGTGSVCVELLSRRYLEGRCSREIPRATRADDALRTPNSQSRCHRTSFASNHSMPPAETRRDCGHGGKTPDSKHSRKRKSGKEEYGSLRHFFYSNPGRSWHPRPQNPVASTLFLTTRTVSAADKTMAELSTFRSRWLPCADEQWWTARSRPRGCYFRTKPQRQIGCAHHRGRGEKGSGKQDEGASDDSGQTRRGMTIAS